MCKYSKETEEIQNGRIATIPLMVHTTVMRVPRSIDLTQPAFYFSFVITQFFLCYGDHFINLTAKDAAFYPLNLK